MVFILIVLGVSILLLIVSRFRKGMNNHSDFFTQVKFIQMYMLDGTEKLFYNKDEDEVVTLGQDILWESAEDFHNRMHEAVNEGKPVPMGDMGMIQSAIKIIKAAEAMVYIKKNGPIHKDDSEKDTEESNVN